jgi:hypothetical protein
MHRFSSWLVALAVMVLVVDASSARARPGVLLSKVERLARQVAPGGWTRGDVHRLVALLEEDGRVTRGERDSVAALLRRRGFVGATAPATGPDNFRGHARAELERYLRLVDSLGEVRGTRGLLGPGRPDVSLDRYKRNVAILSGMRATMVSGPAGRERVVFDDRFVPSRRNQLEQVLRWLTARYQRLGLKVERQPVSWRGRTFYNLVVTIPGASREAVVLCDHYDVADREEPIKANLVQLRRDYGLSEKQIAGRLGTLRVGAPVPGADDSASSTAALLEMGHLMRAQLRQGTRLAKTIKLVHLVGEELPANCLGGRAFVDEAKRRGDRLAGVIVMDMIGVDRTKRGKMQIAVGRPAGSAEMAAEVKRVVTDLGLDLKPVLRPYGARKSFLVQTDGIEFSRAGFPVILLNEHVNNDRDRFRVGYHDEFDIPRLMSFPFATNVVRAALETAYRIAAAK